jgi:hypothetical protein
MSPYLGEDPMNTDVCVGIDMMLLPETSQDLLQYCLQLDVRIHVRGISLVKLIALGETPATSWKTNDLEFLGVTPGGLGIRAIFK